MSVKVMAWVWDHSRAKGSQHHVLLAIADCASDDGSNAYPSMSELVRKTRLSERSVQRAIDALVALGELFVGRNTGPRGCNRYRVIMSGPEGAAATPVNLTPRQFDTPRQTDPRQDDGPRQTDTPQNDTPRQNDTPQNDTPPSNWRSDPVNLAPGTVIEPSERKNSPSESSYTSKIEKSPKPEPKRRPEIESLCKLLADRIEANGYARPNITDGWRRDCRLMIDNDRRDPKDIRDAIMWATGHPFWRRNVRSMAKLRQHYDPMSDQAAQEHQRTQVAKPRRDKDAEAAEALRGIRERSPAQQPPLPIELLRGPRGS